MKLLAIDSSSISASVAVIDDGKILGEFFINSKLTHSETLVPMISSVIKSVRLNLSDIDVFAVTTGPGSFTGVRIAVSVVKAMALALDKPCISVSTLKALAQNLVPEAGEKIICSVMDARCNQVYNSLFIQKEDKLIRLCEDRAITIEELKADLNLREKQVILVGDGSILCYNIFKNNPNISISKEQNRYQRASSVGLCINDEPTLSTFDLKPIYLRLPQAERELKAKQEKSLLI